ncbi:MAG TPA: tRNA (adenosine(37)-N6)-threonylcarbamoyltransferase complex transferase subunit TsaD [Thermodesulfobacteriota bacterium]|nr:tRNA (adenosine(37)-N6)-threonylcarbamoyltransferase complex transferase subunit TsaD [Thermodesulfobacteriota bacterium]
MKVLGIESSCDETAAAVVEDGNKILSSVVASQEIVHKKYGGVVPELASRKHVEAILPVIHEACAGAGLGLKDVEGIAVTQGPGLVGSLLVGIAAAKSLAYVLGIPAAGVDHLLSHVSAVFPSGAALRFPFLALVVSGGHTSLFRVESRTRMRLVGKTRDDAAGEAFDKVAKLLNLGYPGGVVIDRLSREGYPEAISFPRALLEPDSLDFSFSGLKTAVLNRLKGRAGAPTDAELRDTVASFQEAVVDTLVSKVLRAAAREKIGQVVVAGGVACNSRLREKFSREKGIEVYFPPPSLCTDNAAMVAVAGFHLLAEGRRADLTLNAYSRFGQA